MMAFTYRAARQDGEVVAGTLSAPSQAAALHMIASNGLFPVAIDPAAGDRTGRAGDSDLAATLGGIAALLEAGLPVDQALAAAAETTPALRPQLERARDLVREGSSFAAALEASGAVSPIVLGYLRAGERSGLLAAACSRAAGELERLAELRARIRSALTYPAFLAVAGSISLVAILGFVVPRFAALLDTQNQSPPAATRLLLGLSGTMESLGLAGWVTILMATLVGARVLTTAYGRHALHRVLADAPVIGLIRLRLAGSRACSALAGALEAGIPVLAALDMAGQATGDDEFRQRFTRASLDVERGEPVAVSLERQQALSAPALRLVAFGERAGRLPAFLVHAGRLDSAAAQRSIERWVTTLEPALILCFGLVVAFVAAAMLQAVYTMRPAGF